MKMADGNQLFPAQAAAAAAQQRFQETVITPTKREDNTYKEFLTKESGISRLNKDTDMKIGSGFLILIMHSQSCGWKDITSFWETWYQTWLAHKRSVEGWQQETFKTERTIGEQSIKQTPLTEQKPQL